MKEPTTHYQITIHLTQGEPIRFGIDLALADLRNLGSNVEAAMTAKFLGIELGKSLRLLPAHTIREIEISPPPPGVIANVIRGASSS